MIKKTDTSIQPPSSDNLESGLFVPQAYRFSGRAALLQHILEYPLAQIFSAHNGQLRVTATPLIHVTGNDADTDDNSLTFIGHIAKRNEHSAAIAEGAQALAFFAGPAAYISPRWFIDKKTVPTWNYTSVQMQGRFEIIPEPEGVLDVLQKTIKFMESETYMGSTAGSPWSMESAAPELVERLSAQVSAFYFKAESIDGIQRLNQDKSVTDRQSIIAGLRRVPQSDAQVIADMIRIGDTDE